MAGFVVSARSVVQATARARLLTLDLGSHALRFTAGQAVYAGLANSPVRRPYSIASSPTQTRETNAVELLVQINDHSTPDPHLELVGEGMELHLEGPFGSFGLTSPVAERHILLIAGGTGIAPLRSILHEILATQPAVTPALLYSARSRDEFAFYDELTALSTEGRLNLRLTITRSSPPSWNSLRGRIDAQLLDAMLRTAETRCFVCGPPSFVADAVALVRAAGVSETRVGWEAHT